MARIEVEPGISLHVADWGSGPPVVLIHGWPLSADMWQAQSLHLAENGCRVVAYDRRGFGRSDQPWGGYDYDRLADDLAAVMERLDLWDATLVGFSMGGGEVARYMSRHRGRRVAKACLVGAVPPFLLKTPDNPDGVDRSVFDGMREGIRRDRAKFWTDFGRGFYGAGPLTFSVSSEQLQWTANLAMMASPKATLACTHSFSETDFRPDLPAFKVPTLVIHGDDDATVPVEKSGAKTAAAIPGAELKVYEGAPHGLFYTHADRLNADLLTFARR